MKQRNVFIVFTVFAFASLVATPQQDLEQAVKNNDIEVASRIIATHRQGKTKNQWFEFILPSFCAAAKMGRAEILAKCLPINAKLPLHLHYGDDIPQLLAVAICRDDHPEIFNLLRQKSNKLLQSLLQWAVFRGKLAYVMFLVGRGIPVAVNNRSCAFLAAEQGYLGILQYLFEQKAELRNQEALGSYTLLHAAAGSGKLSVVKFLVEECQFSPNRQNGSGKTPLHVAASKGQVEAVQYLLTKNGRLDIQDRRGKTPLGVASNKKIRKLLTEYSQAQANQDERVEDANIAPGRDAGSELGGLAALMEAVEQLGERQERERPEQTEVLPDIHPKDIGLSESASILEGDCIDLTGISANSLTDTDKFSIPKLGLGGIESRVQASKRVRARENSGRSTLPSERRDSEGASHLSANNGRPQFQKAEAHRLADQLIEAAKRGDFDIVQRVLNEGANVNHRTALQSTPLIEAVSNGHLRSVRLLLDRGAEVNSEDFFKQTALEKALEKGHLEIARLLIECRATVNREPDVESPLYMAAKKNNLEAVKLLVRSGAKTEVDFGEYSPLNAAVECGNLALVQYLVEAGVSLHVDSRYRSPVFVAAEKGHLKIAQFLIGKQSVWACQRFNGHYTPLHVAAMRGFAPFVSYLCACQGVRVDLKELNGQTPLHLAAVYGHIEVARALLKAGADITVKTRREETAKILAQQNGHDAIATLLIGFAEKRLGSVQSAESVNAPDDADALDPKLVIDDGRRRSARLCSFAPGKYREISSDDGESETDDTVQQHKERKRKAARSFYKRSIKRAKLTSEDSHEEALLQVVADLADDVIARAPHEKRNTDDSDSERPRKKTKTVRGSEPSAAESEVEEELIAACEAGDIQKIKQYLERDLGLLHAKDTAGVPLIHLLAYSGHKEAFGFLFEKYGNDQVISARTPEGATVLHYAAMGGNLDIVKHLIEKGLSITSKTDKGVTPFMCAVVNGHAESVHEMLKKMNDAEKRALVNQATYRGRLPLIRAAKHGYDKIVRLLLTHGAIVDAYDRNGQTALAEAVRKALQRNIGTEYVSVLKILLAHGARWDQKMANGQTVAEYAQQQGSHNREIMQLLALHE